MVDLDPSGDVPCSQKCDFCEGQEEYVKNAELTQSNAFQRMKNLKLEVNCRREHGAEGEGHLLYIETQLGYIMKNMNKVPEILSSLEGQACLDERDQRIKELEARCDALHSEVGNRGDKLNKLRDGIAGLSVANGYLTEEKRALQHQLFLKEEALRIERL